MDQPDKLRMLGRVTISKKFGIKSQLVALWVASHVALIRIVRKKFLASNSSSLSIKMATEQQIRAEQALLETQIVKSLTKTPKVYKMMLLRIRTAIL